MLREKELILLENLKKENARKTEEIQRLRNNQLIGQASGEETATITDGALAFANILEETEIEVEGEKKKAYLVGLPQGLSRQEQREGYNQLNFKKWINEGIVVKNGTLNNYNEKEITLTTTENDCFIDTLSDSSVPSHNQEIIEKYGSPINKTQYALSCLKNNNSNSRLIVTFFDEAYNYLGIKESQSTNLRHVYNFSVLENTKYITYRFGLLNNDIGTQVTFSEMMLLEGTYTEETLPAYEQYGKTPSREFESPVENVKAWNSINNVAQSTSNNGIDFTVNEDKSITLNGTAAARAYICLTNTNNDINNYTNKILTLKNKYYINPLRDNNISYEIRDTSGNYKSLATLIGEDVGLIYISVVQGATFNNYTIYPMLINGSSESKPYAPYGVIPFKLQNKNYFKAYQSSGIIETNGMSCEMLSYNKVKLNGTTNTDTWFEIGTRFSAVTNESYSYKFIKLDKNKKYKYQIKKINGNVNGNVNVSAQIRSVSGTKGLTISPTSDNPNLEISDCDGIYRTWVYIPNGVTCDNLSIEIQLEEGETATSNITHQEQNYNLHIDLELNGINNVRDSLVIELEDENMSDKKIKKLYLKKKNYKYVFTGNENIIIQATPVSEGVKCYKIVLPKYFSNNYVKADCNRCSFLTDSGEWLNASDKTDIAVLSVAAEGPSMYWRVPEGEFPDVSAMSNYLKNNETYIIYPLKNPEIIDITDNTELVKEVEYLINNVKTFEETTHVEVENGYIDLEYVKSTQLAVNNLQKQIDNINVLMLEGGIGNA